MSFRAASWAALLGVAGLDEALEEGLDDDVLDADLFAVLVDLLAVVLLFDFAELVGSFLLTALAGLTGVLKT